MKVKILIIINYTIFNLLKIFVIFLLFLKIVENVIWNEIKVWQNANDSEKADGNKLFYIRNG